MRAKVIVRQQVRDFIGALAPEPRRKLSAAIKKLADEDKEVLQLEGKLHPYWRLRCGRIRIIFEEQFVRGERLRVCFFADYRATVYKVVEQIIASGLIDELKN
jgi:mRNA-degrading endonuclease RelE of RelBE toxin-antitoxin system